MEPSTAPLPVYFPSIPNMNLPVTLAATNFATEKFFEPVDTIKEWDRRHTSFDIRVGNLLRLNFTKNNNLYFFFNE